jgi:glycosyltransferase involved in cell wall biosynthesis
VRPRLAILTQYFPPETGAPQTRLFELANGLQECGWELEVITAMPNYPHGRIFEGYRGKLWTKEMTGNIRTIRYWLYPSNAAKPIPRIFSMISFSLSALFVLPRLWRFRPNFILVESPPLTLGISAWLLCKLSNTRMIFNISDLWPRTAKELGAISDGWFYRCLEKLESFLYRNAFVCTGQSEEIVDYIQKKGARQVLLFRNGVDTTRFLTAAPSSKISEIAQKGPFPKLVYTGLLGVAQGIAEICQRIDFKALGVEFHIYGAGVEKEKIESLLAQNPDSNMYYHGLISSTEIPDCLSRHDAALVALVRNIYGAVPSKIYEAMAAGLPIFFSGEGEGARIVEKHQVGYVNRSADYEKLAENIKDFVAHKAKALKYAQNGRN